MVGFLPNHLVAVSAEYRVLSPCLLLLPPTSQIQAHSPEPYLNNPERRVRIDCLNPLPPETSRVQLLVQKGGTCLYDGHLWGK